MPTGLHSYYIKRQYVDHNGWIGWVYIKVKEPGSREFLGDCEGVPEWRMATPYRTFQEAEAAAFWLASQDPNLMGLLKVELKAV